MERKEIKQLAREALQKDRWMPVAVTGVYSVIIGMSSVISMVLSGPLSIGVFSYYKKSLNNEKRDFLDLFSGFKDFVKPLCTGLLVMLYTLLWGLIPIVGPIISMVKNYSYSLSLLLLHDNPELSPKEAIEKSIKMMDGHKFDRFVLDLSFILWDLLGFLTLSILNFLYVTPYKQFSVILFYEDIKNEH